MLTKIQREAVARIAAAGVCDPWTLCGSKTASSLYRRGVIVIDEQKPYPAQYSLAPQYIPALELTS